VLGSFGALAAAALVSGSASANTANWGPISGAGHTSPAVEATNGLAFAWAVGHIDASNIQAETNFIPGQTFGNFDTEVTVNCTITGQNSSILTFDGNAIVDCAFLTGTIIAAKGFIAD